MKHLRVAVFSTKPYDREFLEAANHDGSVNFHWLEPRLTEETAPLASGVEAVCLFVHDSANERILKSLAQQGVRLIALRCAGFNNVDLVTASELGITVCRVPAYSPHAVAEHTVGLMLSLNRKFHRAYTRIREGNFALDGLLGFDMRERRVAVIGTGQIGTVVVEILAGFRCNVLAHDPCPSERCLAAGARYVDFEEALTADIVTLHCPLTPSTHHLIDERALAQMTRGAMLINTSRGGLVDARATIGALKQGRLGSLGLDVYEEETDLFYENLSERVIQDDVFARLLTFPNVLVTSHQAFFTREALVRIAETTVDNLTGYAAGAVATENLVRTTMVRRE